MRAVAMHLDVVDLNAFYYQTHLGRVAQRAVRSRVREIWPSSRNQTVAGFGFAQPILRPYLNEARRVISLMPGPQGVMRWPEGRANVSVLCQDVAWPLQTGCVDKLLVLHGLETSEHQSDLLDEIWRVLAPGGKVLFIVPNRSGLWSRRDITPFGHGRPYSLGQLQAQIERHRLAPKRHLAALFSPPSHKRFWLKTSPVLERLGRNVSSHVAGGVLLLEASKQDYAPKPHGLGEAVKRPFGMLEGIGRPAPKPATGRDLSR